MSGKFMRRNAVIDTLKGLEAVNSRQKREGTHFAVRTTQCGCPDDNCGAFHVIETDRPLPTAEDAVKTLRDKKKLRKLATKMSDLDQA